MRKKGASLIWALLVSLALLFITVTTANFVIKESQMSIRMDDSSRAYAAAESGIEWGKYCLAKISPCVGDYPVFYVGTSTYKVTITGAPNTKIESIGTSNGVNRKLEYKVNPNASLTPVEDPVNTTFTIAGSYIQQFDYWTEPGGQAVMGVSSADKLQAIWMEHNAGGLKLFTNAPLRESNSIKLDGIAITDPYALRIRIEYYKDLSAKMIVSRRDDKSSTGYTCVGTAVLDMRGAAKGSSMTKFFYPNGYNVDRVDNIQARGDDSYYSITAGTNVSYFDNMSTLGMTFSSNPAFATVPVYRLFKQVTPPDPNPYIDRIWTISEAEKNTLVAAGYADEKIPFYELATQVPGSVPVYRLTQFDRYGFPHDRLITTSVIERDGLIGSGWKLDEKLFYVFTTQQPGTVPVYRYFNTWGNRIWTAELAEKASLDAQSTSWTNEGPGGAPMFYAFPPFYGLPTN